MDWLTHVPDGVKPIEMRNDEYIPFLFFIRKSTYMTMFEVAYMWMDHDTFNNMVHKLLDIHEIYQHEFVFMSKNGMVV